MRTAIVGAAIGSGFLVMSTLAASAAVVCSGNVCWHATERYTYPPEAKVIIHEDTWKPAADAKITWRERTGRGYWRGDSWVEF